MDQANPYQAPEPVLPTATVISTANSSLDDANEDLIAGLKLLRVTAVFSCITTGLSVFWNFANAYGCLIEDPLKSQSDFYSYWLSFSLSLLGECLFLAGLYFCSTRKLHQVSRSPLLISLILEAAIFPDQLFHFALEKPWIYFEGYGNAHAIYIINYLAMLAWLALDCWLILWATAHHDTRNQRRALLLIFLDVAVIFSRILEHAVYMFLIADQPLSHENYAIFYFVNCFTSLLIFVGGIIAFKIYSSFLTQLVESTA